MVAGWMSETMPCRARVNIQRMHGRVEESLGEGAKNEAKGCEHAESLEALPLPCLVPALLRVILRPRRQRPRNLLQQVRYRTEGPSFAVSPAAGEDTLNSRRRRQAHKQGRQNPRNTEGAPSQRLLVGCGRWIIRIK